MTCDELRKTVADHPPWDLTHGTLASFMAHILRCPECQDFCHMHDNTPLNDPVAEARLTELAWDLNCDPEVTEVAGPAADEYVRKHGIPD